MYKNRPESKNTAHGGYKQVLVLLLASFLLLSCLGCVGGDGVTESQPIPDCSTQATEPAEQTTPTETVLPTESVPEATTEPTEAPTTEPTEAPTVEPTEAPTSAPTTVPTEPTEPSVPETEPPMQIQISPAGTEVLLIPQSARAFSKRDLSKPVEDAIYSYKLVNQRLDISVPVTLSVGITNLPKGVTVTGITITFADNANLNNGRVFRLTGSERSVSIPFLMAGKEYHYQVQIAFSDGSTEIRSASFRTVAAPRMLSIDGIVNVRDCGGWKTTDGYVIRQGVLYRGSELDGAVEAEFKLTEEGLRQMLEDLGIRTDLDLRYQDADENPKSPLGEDVLYIYYDAPSYTSVFKTRGMEVVRKFFADLAENTHYPAYLHCTYGVDRTGTFCYLLGAMLGMSESDLQREYEMSTMYFTWVAPNSQRSLLEGLKAYPGDSLREQTEAYLTACGVTRQQMDTIRDIFLEKQ